MVDLSDKYLLMIEPQDRFKEEEVNDDLTTKMERLFKQSKEIDHTRGWHKAKDGKDSTNCTYLLPSGHITNSLCVHYLRYHRSEVPKSEIAKLISIKEPMDTNNISWNITDLVDGRKGDKTIDPNRVKFKYYIRNELWYEVLKYDEAEDDFVPVSPAFLFPVPISDTGDGKFLAEDKALIFMRYIRQQLQKINDERQHMEQTNT